MASAGFAGEDSQRFSVNGFIQEREAGRAEDAVALGVHVSHQHVVQACTERKRREEKEMADASYLMVLLHLW